jgi:hypothetical protein
VTDSTRLLEDLQAQVELLQDDLRARTLSEPAFDRALRDEYAAAVRVHRTADTFETWREEPVTQGAVSWVLATVFVRFLEDNRLIDPRLSGPADRRRFALDQQAAYFERHPLETDREYLLHVFREVGKLPAARELFDEKHNALSRLTPSGDAAKALLEFWQRVDPATGTIAHELSDPAWDTRLLGDLYQDLSESARKKYALLQTPRFVEAFILDRTLTPAIETFGYREVTLIDPTCGSGHFLLGAFDRLLALYEANEPAANERERVQRVLGQIAGVDLNPFAAAIGRFRLLVAALRACEIARLADAPAFDVNVATGDSLLHGRRFAETGAVQLPLDPDDPSRHHFFAEDARVDRILGRQYHVVVGNPPYITVKDRALNQLYRERYPRVCHMKYALVVPFTERFFELAYRASDAAPAGYVGTIVANSFMKREFGSKLIEQYFKTIDLTHVIDTSGAYIPGHGTPTVILFGRNRAVGEVTRTVMGIRGEPSTPDNPARGRVWVAILAQLDVVDSEDEFVSVRDLAQADLHHHPWSIGGGGASELKEYLDTTSDITVADLSKSIGFGCILGEDEAFVPSRTWLKAHPEQLKNTRVSVVGDDVRDWQAKPSEVVIFPYDPEIRLLPESAVARPLWRLRSVLYGRRDFSRRSYLECGRPYWEYHQIPVDRNRTALSITFAEVATHNHFVFDRGGKVFNRTAPVITLSANASEDDHYALLGLLNSSTACFWIKQVCQTKGSSGVGRGVYDEKWEFFYSMNGTNLSRFPVVTFEALNPASMLAETVHNLFQSFRELATMNEDSLSRVDYDERQEKLIALQEELDWSVYAAYGVADPAMHVMSPPRISLGERAFEIVMARKVAAGELETTWFERHGSTPITQLPEHWPEHYRKLVERRIALIETDRNTGLIERPEYKRRWNIEPWEAQRQRALLDALHDRLEAGRFWPSVQLTSVARLADLARADAEFMRVAEAYRGRPDFDVTTLVTELLGAEAVPYLPVLRYTEAGLRKRMQWARTWELQRQEDAIDALVDLPDDDPCKLTSEQAAAQKVRRVGTIPVPPKYGSTDFKKADYWRLRGKLDVPKERFIVYPGAERSVDPTPVVAWAGWDHLQQAQALADYYVRMLEQDGWTSERLVPLLAGLLQLVPWLKQWHNDLDPSFQVRMGDYFDSFVREQAVTMGVTVDQIRAWAPAAVAPRRRRPAEEPRRTE